MNVINYLKRYWRWADTWVGFLEAFISVTGCECTDGLVPQMWPIGRRSRLWEPHKTLLRQCSFWTLHYQGIFYADPDNQGDQQRPKRQVRPMQTSRDCWTQGGPLETKGDQITETNRDPWRPMEIRWDQQRPLETKGDQHRPLKIKGDQQ